MLMFMIHIDTNLTMMSNQKPKQMDIEPVCHPQPQRMLIAMK